MRRADLSTTLRLRPEREGDAATIAALTTLAFATAEHSSGTEAAIVDGLRRAGDLAVSLVALADDEMVGHAAASPVRIAGRESSWFGLGPVTVSPDRQRRGVGSALVREAIATLRRDGAGGCVVLGDPAYYGRFGFAADPRLRLPGVPAAAFQRLAFGSDVPAGEVSYHPAFDA